MKLRLGKWADHQGQGQFAYPNEPAFAGISGGRTSAMMAALLDPQVNLCFENTGREAEATLQFLLRLEDAIERKITWLEWRPPPRRGDRPNKFGFEVVDYQTATKQSGVLFDALQQALADYRQTKGLGPIVPHPTMRICTGYLKHKTQTAYMRSIGVADSDPHTQYVGLRVDEPERIARLIDKETQARSYKCPLAAVGITKQDVNEFWASQPFDLGIPHDRWGNCTVCFLKDHADQSRMLGEEEADSAWWIDIQRRYPGFGGNSHPGYAQLLKERPVRLAIEKALIEGRDPMTCDDGTLDKRRFKLVVTNEKRYFANDRVAFSCACESSYGIGEDDEDEENAA